MPSASSPIASGAGWSISVVSAVSFVVGSAPASTTNSPAATMATTRAMNGASLRPGHGAASHELGRRERDTASVGRRRRVPGNAASNVPMAITAPPIHSHRISGLTNTRIVASVAPAWRRARA